MKILIGEEVKVGDAFEKDYPFHLYSYPVLSSFGESTDEAWMMGCRKTQEDDGSEYSCTTFHNADGLGKIIFEVLAVTVMPRKFKDRVLYKFDRVDPDGKRMNGNKCYTVTIDHFLKMIDKLINDKIRYLT